MAQKIHLNTLLDIMMMMMSLDHYVKLPQMIGYVENFDSNKTMSFKVSDNKLLKKYNKIWGRISNLMNMEFDAEPVYGNNDKYKNKNV